MADNKNIVVSLVVPKETPVEDMAVMTHVGAEAKSLAFDGYSDLCEYGSGDVYEMTIIVYFERKAGN